MKMTRNINEVQQNPVKVKKITLKEEGNIKIAALYEIILTKNGKPDRLAIDIYIEARSWYKPKKTKVRDNIIYSSKLMGYGWQTGYEDLVRKYKCSHDLIRTKLVLLENLGLLQREFRTEYYHGKRFNNNMYILVWKDTPYFYSEIGLEKKVEFTPQNQGDISKNSSPPILKNKESLSLNSRIPLLENKENIYVIPNNKEKEEEPYGSSSSFSVITPSKEKEEAKASSNEKLKIKNFSEEQKQEENIELQTLAASPFDGLAKVQQKEETRRETSFSPSQSAIEEKEYLRSHGKRESSVDEPIPLVSLPIFAKLCNPHISEEKEETQTVIIEKIEEMPKVDYNSREPDNLNHNCEMETDINTLIFKAFGNETGKQLIKNCEINLIEPDKVGIKIQGITITNYEKEQLRSCIRSKYGENIKIVLLNKPEEKLRVNKETDVQPAVETPERLELWEIFKKAMKTQVAPQQFKNWFENGKLECTQVLNENKLIFMGSDFIISWIKQNFYKEIEKTVIENEIAIEFRFQGYTHSSPIIYEVEETKIRHKKEQRYYEHLSTLVPKK